MLNSATVTKKNPWFFESLNKGSLLGAKILPPPTERGHRIPPGFFKKIKEKIKNHQEKKKIEFFALSQKF